MTLPKGTTNEQKAVWLGGLMLIDYVFFEKEKDDDNDMNNY